MSRRRFLQASALLGAGAGMGGFAMTAAHGQVTRGGTGPHRILMSGYGPPTTSFSLALKRIGDRLEARFGDDYRAYRARVGAVLPRPPRGASPP